MRLWSLDPALLDRRALVAGWREALLAQKVLHGLTRGYTRHPQLERFRAAPDPLGAMAAYLHGLADEADARGYRFDRSRITTTPVPSGLESLTVTSGQLDFELLHLSAKVRERDPDWMGMLSQELRPHPLFRVIPGQVEEWERGQAEGPG